MLWRKICPFPLIRKASIFLGECPPSLRIALPVIDSDANCLLPWLGRHNLDKTYKCHCTELNIAFLVM